MALSTSSLPATESSSSSTVPGRCCAEHSTGRRGLAAAAGGAVGGGGARSGAPLEGRRRCGREHGERPTARARAKGCTRDAAWGPIAMVGARVLLWMPLIIMIKLRPAYGGSDAV